MNIATEIKEAARLASQHMDNLEDCSLRARVVYSFAVVKISPRVWQIAQSCYAVEAGKTPEYELRPEKFNNSFSAQAAVKKLLSR